MAFLEYEHVPSAEVIWRFGSRDPSGRTSAHSGLSGNDAIAQRMWAVGHASRVNVAAAADVVHRLLTEEECVRFAHSVATHKHVFKSGGVVGPARNCFAGERDCFGRPFTTYLCRRCVAHPSVVLAPVVLLALSAVGLSGRRICRGRRRYWRRWATCSYNRRRRLFLQQEAALCSGRLASAQSTRSWQHLMWCVDQRSVIVVGPGAP
jgi:hypothetical protein